MSAYLLTAALLISTIPALARQKGTSAPESASKLPPDHQTQVAPREPWNLFANKTLSFPPDVRIDPMIVQSVEQLRSDTLCYTMRSYVVARDSKDSDSVHPVGYSTCQPASRYRLRTTEIRTLTLDR